MEHHINIMTIDTLIDREVYSLSILDEMYEVGKWLTERPYYAIVQEDLKVAGIITVKDFHLSPHHLVIDAKFENPKLKPENTVFEAAKEIIASDNCYLPVFDENDFVGVISLKAIATAFIELQT
jgi:predicted transcriptional regulator